MGTRAGAIPRSGQPRYEDSSLDRQEALDGVTGRPGQRNACATGTFRAITAPPGHPGHHRAVVQQQSNPCVRQPSGEPWGIPAALPDEQVPVLRGVHRPDDVGDLLIRQVGPNLAGTPEVDRQQQHVRCPALRDLGPQSGALRVGDRRVPQGEEHRSQPLLDLGDRGGIHRQLLGSARGGAHPPHVVTLFGRHRLVGARDGGLHQLPQQCGFPAHCGIHRIDGNLRTTSNVGDGGRGVASADEQLPGRREDGDSGFRGLTRTPG